MSRVSSVSRASGGSSFAFRICVILNAIFTPAIASITSTGGAGPDENLGFSAEAALSPNALSPNALSPNALSPNALSPNALGPAAMSAGAMTAIQDPGEAGDLSRQLLRYTVGCAFTTNQTFDFTWTDQNGTAHAESYHGLVGLAPGWATQPLDPAGQQWVSACLASRVNALGVSVMLSLRGSNPVLTSTASERATYSTREGVFFGNLFASTPRIYACFDPVSMVPSQLAHRVCAQPDLLALNPSDLLSGYDCGPIHVIGPCFGLVGLSLVGVCDHEDFTSRYLDDCTPPGGSQPVASITTFLQGPIPW